MAYIGFEPVNTFSPVPTKDSFTGDGSTVVFDIQNEVVFGGENALEVFVDNVRQEPGSGKAFTLGLNGSLENKRITFSAAPASGAAIYVINDKTSNVALIRPEDLNGVEFILDADGDTSITADTDDRIDFKLANVDHINIGTSSGDTVFTQMTDAKDIIFKQFDGNKIFEINDGNFVGVGGNSTAAGEIRIFEDTDNGTNYSGFTVGNLTASVAYQLPNADGSSGTQLTTNGSGVLSWAAAEIALANDGNNRIVTGTGSASLNAEANLTFDGSTLALTGAATVSSTLAVSGVTTSNAGVVVDNITIDGTEIDLSSGDLLVDVAGDITLDAGGGDWLFNVATTNILKISNSSSDVIIKPIVDAKDIIFQQRDGTEVARIEDNATFNVSTAGKFAYAGVAVTATAAELNILDDATITTTELNLLDGGTSASSVTIADADRIILNDNGTMKQVAVSALNAYTSATIAADDISIGDAAVLLSTSSGNIVVDAAANDSDIIFKGTDGGSDTTFLTIDGSAAGAATFNDNVIITDGKLVLGSTAVTSTAAELNVNDGVTLGTAIASKVVTTDANIDTTGQRNLTISGELDAATLDISGAIDVAGTSNLDVVDIDGAVDMASTLQVDGVATFTAVPVFPNNTIETADIQADAIDGTKIADDAINSEHYTDGSIDTAHIGADQITNAKIADDQIDSEHYVDGSIDTAHIAADQITNAKIADDQIDSEHYVDGSIDTAHLADGQITIAKLATAVLTGATDIGADLVDADLFLVDDGAGGTLRKTTAERIKTYIGGGTSWQAIKTGAYTAVAGQGVFANTTSSAFTVTLPASPALGDEVTVVDYAGTFDSNACTIGRNSQPIQGVAEDLVVSTERASFTLVYVDGTQGWLFKND